MFVNSPWSKVYSATFFSNSPTLLLLQFCICFSFHRLTIPLALLILFAVGLSPVIGYGPFWWVVEDMEQNCANNWWTNVLYVNNFVKTDEPCIGQTWYLAVDMQLFLVSPLVFMPMYR